MHFRRCRGQYSLSGNHPPSGLKLFQEVVVVGFFVVFFAVHVASISKIANFAAELNVIADCYKN